MRTSLLEQNFACLGVNRDAYLAITCTDCAILGSTKCDYNTLNEVALKDGIDHARRSVDDIYEASAGRGVVIVEGHNLMFPLALGTR